MTGFIYDWSWILHGICLLKNPCYGEPTSWAGQRRCQQTFCFIWALQEHVKRVAPIAVSLFIKRKCFTSLWSLELSLCWWARVVIRLTWNPAINGGQIHYLRLTQRHFVWLHLRLISRDHQQHVATHINSHPLRVTADKSQWCLILYRMIPLVFRKVAETEFRAATQLSKGQNEHWYLSIVVSILISKNYKAWKSDERNWKTA